MGQAMTIEWSEVVVAFEPCSCHTPATERVARGAAVFDQKRPGWENRINLDDFDIRSARCCAVKQVCGDYTTGIVQLGVDDVAAFGFAGCGEDDYNRLNDEWRRVILDRRAAAPVEAPPAVWVHRSPELKELVQA